MLASYLLLVPLIVLIWSAIQIILLRIWRPRLSYYWLTATFFALISWLAIFLVKTYLPVNLTLSNWQPVEIFPLSLTLSVDPFSWLFALGAITILLAVNLTGIADADRETDNAPDWMSFAGSAGITGLSLFVMFASNILTVLLAWMLLDLVEFIIYLSLAKDRRESEKVVIKFSTRVSGLLIGIYAGISAYAQNLPLALNELTSATSGLLILAVCVRIGLIPNTPILPFQLPQQTGYGALLRLVTTSANFPLLVKAAVSGGEPQLQNFLWIWTGLTALLSAFSWFSSTDIRSGRHYWVIALSCLVIASAINAQPLAVMAWGWTLILPGGLILVSNDRNRWLRALFILGILAMLGLPYSPSWFGWLLFSGNFHIGWLMLLVAQSLVIAGYLIHVLKKSDPTRTTEGWTRWIFAWGLFLIILTTYLLSYWSLQGSLGIAEQNPPLLMSWPVLVILILLLLIWLGDRYIPSKVKDSFSGISEKLSFGIILKPLWSFFFLIRRGLLFISRILESQSGILWALLILVLLISLFSQRI